MENLILIWCLNFFYCLHNFKFDVSSQEFIVEDRRAIAGISLLYRGLGGGGGVSEFFQMVQVLNFSIKGKRVVKFF